MASCPHHPDTHLKRDPQGLTGYCYRCDQSFPLCQAVLALASCLYLEGHKSPHHNRRGDIWYGTS